MDRESPHPDDIEAAADRVLQAAPAESDTERVALWARNWARWLKKQRRAT